MNKLLISVLSCSLLFMYGCAEETLNSKEDSLVIDNTNKLVLPEEVNADIIDVTAIDNSFYNEYTKYVTNAPAEYSQNATNNVKSIIINLTGRGKMPASVGMGDIKYQYAGLAVSKKISDAFKNSKEAGIVKLTDYNTLNTDDNTFMQTVMDGMLSGTEGFALLFALKDYAGNQLALSKLAKEHILRFQGDNKEVYTYALTNISYLYGYITENLKVLNIAKLPEDDKSIKSIVDVVYNHCKDKPVNQNIIKTFNGKTTTFNINSIITCDTNASLIVQEENRKEFMDKIGKLFDPNYEYNRVVLPEEVNADIIDVSAIDNSFYNEYTKYVTNAPAEYSQNAANNVKSIIINLTGRGKMPAGVGMGDIKYQYAGLAVSKKISDAFKNSKEAGIVKLIDYNTLNTDSDTFMKTVMDGMLVPEGFALLFALKDYAKNQLALSKLAKEHILRFQGDNKEVYTYALTNISYLYGYIIENIKTTHKIEVLPEDDKSIKSIVDVVYNHCKDKPVNNNIMDSFNVKTVTFNPDLIAMCDDKSTDKDKNKQELMDKLNKVLKPAN